MTKRLHFASRRVKSHDLAKDQPRLGPIGRTLKRVAIDSQRRLTASTHSVDSHSRGDFNLCSRFVPNRFHETVGAKHPTLHRRNLRGGAPEPRVLHLLLLLLCDSAVCHRGMVKSQAVGCTLGCVRVCVGIVLLIREQEHKIGLNCRDLIPSRHSCLLRGSHRVDTLLAVLAAKTAAATTAPQANRRTRAVVDDNCDSNSQPVGCRMESTCTFQNDSKGDN